MTWSWYCWVSWAHKQWGRFRYWMCYLLFKDIVLEILTDYMHPDFGSMWQPPDGEAYLACEQARINGGQEMLGMVVGSLRGYPHLGGDIEVMREVDRLIKEAIEKNQ